MAVVMSDSSCPYKRIHDPAGEAEKPAHYTRIIGRKRVAIPQATGETPFSSPVKKTSFQKRRSRRSCSGALNRLELLPQDILVRILCCANHSDLKQLIFVSKAIRDAALIAKELHFAFRTPMPKLTVKGDSNAENVNEYDGHEAPNAPRRISKARLGGKDLASISIALFASSDEL